MATNNDDPALSTLLDEHDANPAEPSWEYYWKNLKSKANMRDVFESETLPPLPEHLSHIPINKALKSDSEPFAKFRRLAPHTGKAVAIAERRLKLLRHKIAQDPTSPALQRDLKALYRQREIANELFGTELYHSLLNDHNGSPYNRLMGRKFYPGQNTLYWANVHALEEGHAKHT